MGRIENVIAANKMRRKVYTEGSRYALLTLMQECVGRHTQADFICDCGNKIKANMHNVVNGTTKSCGCLQREIVIAMNIKHKSCHLREYGIWQGMISRCSNRKKKTWRNYGGRGIIVCERWRKDFERFYEDMGKCPDNYSIDRINNDGNYEPSNCRWATHKEQANNRRPRRRK